MNKRSKSEGASAEIFSALTNPIRWSIFELLANGEVITATALAPSLNLSPSATSYHMRELQRAGLIESVQQGVDGRERYWRIRKLHIDQPRDQAVGESVVVARTMASAHDDVNAIAQVAHHVQDDDQTSGSPSFLDVHVVEASRQEALALTVSMRHLFTSLLVREQAGRERSTDDTTRYRITLMMRPLPAGSTTVQPDPAGQDTRVKRRKN